jgi:rhodanese-related sulfurtransferase
MLIAVAFLPAIGEAIYFRDKVSWQSRITASEMVDVDLALSWGASVIWADARPDNEYEQGHVPEAVLLNEDRWDNLLPQFLEKWSPDKKVVVYCSTKSCNLAGDVARRLREEAQLKDNEGKNCVFVLEGGWEEWQRRVTSDR